MICIRIYEDGTVSADSETTTINYKYDWEDITLKEIVEDIKEVEEIKNAFKYEKNY